MNFGEAIKAVKAGKKIQRAGWNGKNQYVQLGWLASQSDMLANDWREV